jgi:N-methylhydantoinase B
MRVVFGFGLTKDYRIVNSEASFTCSFGRSVYPSWGMEGGQKGIAKYLIIMKQRQARRKAKAVTATHSPEM